MELTTAAPGLETAAELCAAFGKDDSEFAGIALAEILKRRFNVPAAAAFYKTPLGFRFFPAGGPEPKTLYRSEWMDGIIRQSAGKTLTDFGPWAMPGYGPPEKFWITLTLKLSKTTPGYIILGRSSEPWQSRAERDSLKKIGEIISPIARMRIEKRSADAEKTKKELQLTNERNRLQGLIDSSPDLIYAADPKDHIININRAGMQLLGIKNPGEIIGKKASEFAFNPGDRAVLAKKLREEGFLRNYAIRLKGKNGRPVYCLESSTAVTDAGGKLIEYQGIIKDITSYVAIEQELKEANRSLAQANENLKKTQSLMVHQEKLASIGQLAAGIAHEINNPLSFLKSNYGAAENYIARLKTLAGTAPGSPDGDTKSREMDRIFGELDDIYRESGDGFDRIINIIRDLGSFSRSSETEDFSQYDVNEGIRSTLAVARNGIKDIARVKTKLGNVPMIRARGGEINQVILNIVMNAVQAIGSEKNAEKGLIEISTQANGPQVRIIIRDNGPGIPPAVISKIFDPFFTTKDPGKGTGLGLSISYHIIAEKHRGSITVQSKEGKGTSFIIDLPVNGPPKTE
ncbi:sensor histidine kinase [Breznakiella homolactica]|uniref:histidine kinase n=1 Tax=Breznakiella homolactica TaxID=2798577 RepID=A0A7T7XN71_9SPIR|nr:ATP-binding protein [Breznakiella homolactica]QQO09357.1 PAS domain S-box protein [Breznakiella homolactica]